MPIYGINPLQIFFPGTSGPILTKLGMKHWRLNFIIFCSNDNHRLAMTCFTAWSMFFNLGFYRRKCDNDGFLENYCIL